jgi:hypothetical protein
MRRERGRSPVSSDLQVWMQRPEEYEPCADKRLEACRNAVARMRQQRGVKAQHMS